MVDRCDFYSVDGRWFGKMRSRSMIGRFNLEERAQANVGSEGEANSPPSNTLIERG
jgi:hypothetical protein